MTKRIQRLYPPPHATVELRGLYLEHAVHRFGSREAPFVYANFLSSLDGRIAVADTVTGRPYLPKHLTTPDDFRLFLELEAQADCLITHGGYLRALHEGRLGNILQIGTTPETADLARWRVTAGLPPQPAVVVASASLEFPLPASLRANGQTCYIATGAAAPIDKVRYWERQGFCVLRAGVGRMVHGDALVRILGGLGFRCLYLIAGPDMLETMLLGRRLARLYHTVTHQLLGGESFRTVIPGPQLGPLGHLRLRTLYYDPESPAGAGQWFAQFEPAADDANQGHSV